MPWHAEPVHVMNTVGGDGARRRMLDEFGTAHVDTL